jgi:hypothetical protein
MPESIPLYPYHLDPAKLGAVLLLIPVKANRFASRARLREVLLAGTHDDNWQEVLDKATASELADYWILSERR